MKYRTLGQSLEVSALGLGCMPMGGRGNDVYGLADEDEAMRTLHRALDLGVTFFDTAEAYGPYGNEELLRRAFAGRRERPVIATKFGFRLNDKGAIIGTDGSAANARQVCEASLLRLGVETIDLFYLHRVDPATPIEETVGGMAELVKEGKVRHLGLSESSAATLRRAHATHPIAALQSEYSLWEREVETEILPTCRELGVGFVPFSPLGRGFLAGNVTSTADFGKNDFRNRDPRYDAGNFEANLALVESVKGVAKKHGVSAAQVALAWLLAQGEDIVPIPGVKRRKTMEDSVAAVDLALDADDLATLAAAAPIGGTAGERYRPEFLKMARI